MNILIVGAPGSGKGTMSALLVEKYGIKHISSGDIFRSEIKNGSELGLLAKSYMEKGELVPDNVTNPMVVSYIENSDLVNGYLLDGYPRTINQCLLFEELTSTNDRLSIDIVINLNLDRENIIKRVCGRYLCPNCNEIYHLEFKKPLVLGICDKCGSNLIQRKDDTLESIVVRLDAFYSQTEPVLEYYRERGKLIDINSDQKPELVFKDIVEALGDLMND